MAKAQFFFTYSNFFESKWHCFEKRLFYSLDLHKIFFYISGILQRNECLSEMLLFIRKCKNLLHYLNHFVKFKDIEPIPPPHIYIYVNDNDNNSTINKLKGGGSCWLKLLRVVWLTPFSSSFHPDNAILIRVASLD